MGIPRYFSAEIALRNRNALSRPERQGLKRSAILVQRQLAFGTAVDVIEDDARQSTFSEPSQITDADDVRSCDTRHMSSGSVRSPPAG